MVIVSEPGGDTLTGRVGVAAYLAELPYPRLGSLMLLGNRSHVTCVFAAGIRRSLPRFGSSSLEYHHLRCNTWGRGGDQRGLSKKKRNDGPRGALLFCPRPFGCPLPSFLRLERDRRPTASTLGVATFALFPHPEILRTSTVCSRTFPIPHRVVIATSAASRPTAIGIRAGRTVSVVASMLCHAPLR